MPRVDVYYCGEEQPQYAVVKVELPGVDLGAVNLEVRGRALVISGEKPVRETEGRTYQQVELPSGPFRRVIELSVDVEADRAEATYEDGVLRIELPIRLPDARPADESRSSGTDERVRPWPTSRRPELEVVEIPELDDVIRGQQPLPDALPVLPLRETVTFPDTLTPLAVGQERSIKLVNDVLSGNRMLAMVASKDPENEQPGPEDLYDVGVAGTVARMLKVPGRHRCGVLVQGGERIKINDYVSEDPYLVARIEPLPDVVEPSPELEALTRNVQNTFSEIIEQIPYLPEELQLAVTNMDDPSALSHLIAGALRISLEEKQELLEEVDVAKRLRRLSEILARELEVVRLGAKIQSDVESEIGKGQREYFLREQLKAIQQELGEGDEQQAEMAELRERIEQAELPEEAHKAGRARAGPAREAAARRGRVRRHPHLPRMAGRPALVEGDRGQPRHRARPRGPRRGPLRPRGGQGPDPRVPGGPQAQPRVARARSSASSARPGSARPASASRSPAPSGASSSASRSAASATRPRSAATGAPTSARCRARSSAPCATRAPATRC